MQPEAIKLYWVIIITFVGLVAFIVRTAISRNATKDTVNTKIIPIEKDIEHIKNTLKAAQRDIDNTNKRVSDLRDNSKTNYVGKEVFEQQIRQLDGKLDTLMNFHENSRNSYVSKELFDETVKQMNHKLDTILKFVEK